MKKYIFTEQQIKKIIVAEIESKKEVKELKISSEIVSEFIEKVKNTPGLLQHLKFDKLKNLIDYIEESGIKEFDELRDEAKEFKKNKK